MRLPKHTLFSELFGSKNVKSGGVGRVDRLRVLAVVAEADFLAACKALGFRVWQIGTDYVVAGASVSFAAYS